MREDISAVPVFVAVVECGSFSRAAERLRLTTSAVSKRVQSLEEQLGVRLLHRTTRHVSLTEAGERYHRAARAALDLLEEGEVSASRLQAEVRGQLRLSVPMVFGRLHLSPLIPAFLAAHPGVSVDMAMDDRMVDLVEGGFDLAIRIGHLPDSSLVSRRLATCLSVVCASPGYLARHGMPTHPADLAGHDCLQYAYYRGGADWVFDSDAGAVSVTPAGRYRVNNSEALRDAVLAGAGIAQLPTFIVGPDLQAGRLVPVLTEFPLPRHAIHAVYPERRHVPAKVTAFLALLEASFGGEVPYWDMPPASST